LQDQLDITAVNIFETVCTSPLFLAPGHGFNVHCQTKFISNSFRGIPVFCGLLKAEYVFANKGSNFCFDQL